MYTKIFISNILFLSIVSISGYKIGVINDFHMNTYYDQTTSANTCWGDYPIMDLNQEEMHLKNRSSDSNNL
jgi:hypothetical protein